jgi:hypothetical protein
MAAEELFAVMLERALRLGYWDGVEPITASVLGSRVPVHFFANCNEAALTGRDGFQPLPADEARACDCPPGSIQKIEALAARVQSGEDLWHPADALAETWNEANPAAAIALAATPAVTRAVTPRKKTGPKPGRKPRRKGGGRHK